mmetsp:Transcript_33769/g.85486  ORF Transcript_33769/g.85486 Transcript_33769/m.85486 type:complete len:454 (+) Transcript_33769:1404-2765(+)
MHMWLWTGADATTSVLGRLVAVAAPVLLGSREQKSLLSPSAQLSLSSPPNPSACASPPPASGSAGSSSMLNRARRSGDTSSAAAGSAMVEAEPEMGALAAGTAAINLELAAAGVVAAAAPALASPVAADAQRLGRGSRSPSLSPCRARAASPSPAASSHSLIPDGQSVLSSGSSCVLDAEGETLPALPRPPWPMPPPSRPCCAPEAAPPCCCTGAGTGRCCAARAVPCSGPYMDDMAARGGHGATGSSPASPTSCRASVAACPARTCRTGVAARWMPVTATATKLPSAPGPTMSCMPTRTRPDTTVPDTTWPTPSTEYTPSTWKCVAACASEQPCSSSCWVSGCWAAALLGSACAVSAWLRTRGGRLGGVSAMTPLMLVLPGSCSAPCLGAGWAARRKACRAPRPLPVTAEIGKMGTRIGSAAAAAPALTLLQPCSCCVAALPLLSPGSSLPA